MKRINMLDTFVGSILKTMIHILVGFKGDNLIYLIDKIQDKFITTKEKKITHTSKKMK